MESKISRFVADVEACYNSGKLIAAPGGVEFESVIRGGRCGCATGAAVVQLGKLEEMRSEWHNGRGVCGFLSKEYKLPDNFFYGVIAGFDKDDDIISLNGIIIDDAVKQGKEVGSKLRSKYIKEEFEFSISLKGYLDVNGNPME